MKETQLTVLLQCMNQRTLNRLAVHIKDRISNIKAMVLAFLVENNISFSTVGKSLILKIVETAKMLYSDQILELLCKKRQLPKNAFRNGTEMPFKKNYPKLHVETL